MACITVTHTATRKRKSRDEFEDLNASFKKSKATLAQSFYVASDDMMLEQPIDRDDHAVPLQMRGLSPNEVLDGTTTYMPGHDLLRARLASRDFHRVINPPQMMHQKLQTTRLDRSLTSHRLSSPQQLAFAPGFFNISNASRHGSVSLDRVPPGGLWRHIPAFQPTSSSVIIRIPGCFSSHPVLKAPREMQGVTLGMIADAFLQHAPWEFWKTRKAEFFALPESSEQASCHASVKQNFTTQSVATSAYDAMDFELCRDAQRFDSGWTYGSETMCLG